MRDDLLKYYKSELAYMRRTALGFKRQFPKIASRLVIEESGETPDPHVERLVEAFAFLAARIHLKIDDDFPEITEALLQTLYPHYLRPLPSTTIVQLKLDPEQGKLSTGFTIPRHRRLLSQAATPRGGMAAGDGGCRFRTCYPVTLWPLEVTAARLDVGVTTSAGRSYPAAVSLTVKTTASDVRFADLDIQSLRVFIAGESQSAHRIYETVFGHGQEIEVHGGTRPLVLPKTAIADVGFEADDGLIPYSHRSFLGYRLLQEYFHFPAKFLFFDLRQLGGLRALTPGQTVTFVIYLDALPALGDMLSADQFRLGCTPAVNLFQKTAEPIRLDHAHTEYRVVPDVARELATEVYSVDEVTSTGTDGRIVQYQPFYSFKHSFERQQQQTFWYAARRPSPRENDPGTEVFLTLVDLGFRPTRPASDVVMVGVTCTNRDVAGQLPFGNPNGDFSIEGAAPVRRVLCMTKPTDTVRPPLGHRLQWRLISHLSLNFVSSVDGGADRNPEALQEILRLYDFSQSDAVQHQILGITGVSSQQVWRRIVKEKVGSGFARGVEATLEFDESKFVGSGVYLFSAVLERFFGLAVTINAFSETVATSKQRGLIKRWPPRAGQQALL